MLAPKPIPPRTLDSLLPPNLDYAYFAGAQTWPFRQDAARFDLLNASWLADAALLAYADEPFARAQWERAGATALRAFRGTSTLAYVASGDRWVIVSFRGTQVVKRLLNGRGSATWADVVRDWKTDADIRLERWPRGGKVHRGFKEAFEQVWDSRGEVPGLSSYLDEVGRATSRRVWFTGHSLGAALAILAAQTYGSAAGVYTFGSPRVGTRAFVEAYPVPVYRVVNATDAVTTVPPAPYEPVGALHYIASNGQVDGAPTVLVRATDWLRGTLRGIVPGFSAFADHAPLFYATHTWNACVEAQATQPFAR